MLELIHENPHVSSATVRGGPMKKAIVAVTSFVMIAWVGIGAYLLFFQGGAKGGADEKVETPAPKPEKKETPKDNPPPAPTGISSIISTVNEESDWRLETPIDTLNFDDPKDRDKARRKIARDIRVGNRNALAALKESTAEEKEKKARSEAIEAWLEKGTRQDAIQ